MKTALLERESQEQQPIICVTKKHWEAAQCSGEELRFRSQPAWISILVLPLIHSANMGKPSAKWG